MYLLSILISYVLDADGNTGARPMAVSGIANGKSQVVARSESDCSLLGFRLTRSAFQGDGFRV